MQIQADLNLTNNQNIFWIGNRGLEAAENQIIILQDEYKSGYECELCGDREHRFLKGSEAKQESIIDCVQCGGAGRVAKAGRDEMLFIRCTACEGSGKVTCPKCAGKGSPSVVIPDDQKGRPTTGTVVSAGENVKRYKLGDRLLVPAFAGHGLELAGINMATGKQEEAVITILLENDILAKVHGGEIEKRMFRRSMALSTVS